MIEIAEMIQIKRNRQAIPSKYRGQQLQALLEKLLAGYYEFHGKIPFNKEKGRFQQWKGAKTALMSESQGKCAYCESNTSVVAYGDVEHFRPKDIYWWLAFSYDNYTYSCQLCNQKFKGAYFPIAGKKITLKAKLPATIPPAPKLSKLASKLCLDPMNADDAKLRTIFKLEKAHLPHPYLDNPERLFAWEADDINREVHLVENDSGIMAKRALEAAEKYLGLNREELRRARYAQYTLVHAHCLVLQESNQITIQAQARNALEAAASDAQPYSGMTRYFLRQWKILA